MKRLISLLLPVVLFVTAVPLGARQAPAPSGERQLPRANYDLAAQWMSNKVGKYVFSTAVTPRWLNSGDRFWYTYETPAGQNWWLVDAVKKAKTPLWDNAKMAAQLTRILRTPYDSDHLPIGTIRFFDNDTKIRFSVRLPVASRVETASGEELTGLTQQQENQTQQGGGRGRGGRGGDQQQQGGRGAGGAAGANETAEWWLVYDLATGVVTLDDKYKPETPTPTWAQVSPDKKTVVFARGHNLFLMDAAAFEAAKKKEDDPAIAEVQLTTDGEAFHGYAANSGRSGGDDEEDDQQNTQGGGRGGRGAARQTYVETEQDKKFGRRTRAIGAVWSQDSSRFSVTRNDSRKVNDLWVINSLANPRPRLETYKYGMPGEPNQPQTSLQVFDIATKKGTAVKTDAFKDQQMGLATAVTTNFQRENQDTAARWITSEADKVYFNRTSRDLKRIDIVEGNTITGESRVVIAERSNTYIEIQPLRLLKGGAELIHWSERDGWGHYYLYGSNGRVIRQITSGEFVTTGIVGVDEPTRTLFFTAVGREAGEDPYFQHLYRVNIDTGEVKLLNAGNFSHAVSMNDKSTFFVNNASRVDTAPVSALYDAQGTKVMDLERTDVASLLEAGFRYPESFSVKADDGITDLYGTMYKPFDFDPAKKYPVILFVYPGPQTESVTKTFSPRNANVAIANLGFLVVEVGNRGGNPQRSKWYHNYGYGNLRDYGLSDKKAAVEQLAKRHAWVDLNRVGIYGHSGGGFMTAAAMFTFPDFFKVGVSSAGNHDNAVYNRWWSEKHDGVMEVTDEEGNVTFQYDIDKNQDVAKNLKGKLLLIHGDMDNNVHPAGTLRVVDALIKANKRFDFLIIPGARHGYAAANDYVFWRRADYFAQHLLGAPPMSVDIIELTREQQIRR